MEEKQEVSKVRRIFSPEQKFEILKDTERCKTIKEGLAKHHLCNAGVLSEPNSDPKTISERETIQITDIASQISSFDCTRNYLCRYV